VRLDHLLSKDVRFGGFGENSLGKPTRSFGNETLGRRNEAPQSRHMNPISGR
jgi:hypothetical protein